MFTLFVGCWGGMHKMPLDLISEHYSKQPDEPDMQQGDIPLLKKKLAQQFKEQLTIGKIQYIFPKLSKPIIDEIDTALAEHYGFTEEELDFIINYDIKYMLGKELEGEE